MQSLHIERVIKQSDPLGKIQSFRNIIREQTYDNDRKLMYNQESLKNIIHPQITKKEHAILSPVRTAINFADRHSGFTQGSVFITNHDHRNLSVPKTIINKNRLKPLSISLGPDPRAIHETMPNTTRNMAFISNTL